MQASQKAEKYYYSSSSLPHVTDKYRLRKCAGGKDYSAVIGSVDAWWGGRRVSPMLPRLFFENFCDTTFMAVRDGADGKEVVVGFLCGFVSQSRVGEVRKSSTQISTTFISCELWWSPVSGVQHHCSSITVVAVALTYYALRIKEKA